MNKIKVLYIDDEEINLEVFYSTFRRKYDVYTAISAEEGMRILNEKTINIVISDQRMPIKTGVSFFEEVKVKHPDTIRIILTAYADYETAFDSINRGYVFRFIQKPWDFDELQNTIEDSYKIYALTNRNKELLSQYQLLFDHHSTPVFIINKENNQILKANESAIKFFSITEVNMNINQLLSIDEIIAPSKPFTQVTKGNGETRLVAVKYDEILWENELCYLVSLEDQTEVIELKRKKIEYLSKIQSDERKQLSMELHDGFAQDLVLLKLCFEKLSEPNEETYKEFMDTFQKVTNGIRSISYNLDPPDLIDGISNGVKKLFARLNSVSKVNFIYENNDPNSCDNLIDEVKSYHIYRVIQEFVNNSLKYANAKNINVIFDCSDNHLVIILKDDGVGFDFKSISFGAGLKNMEDRCLIANIDFDIQSRINEGVELKIKVL